MRPATRWVRASITDTAPGPLEGIAGRMYISGVLTNTPQHIIRWIQEPRSIDSATAMPNVGVTEDDARHIAAYL